MSAHPGRECYPMCLVFVRVRRQCWLSARRRWELRFAGIPLGENLADRLALRDVPLCRTDSGGFTTEFFLFFRCRTNISA